MIICELKGGLGNQLFQIFMTINYSLKYSIPFYFKMKPFSSIYETERHLYFDTLLKSIEQFLMNNETKYNLKCHVIIEKTFSYNNQIENNIKNATENLYVCGYFQSFKYFMEYETQIKKLLQINKSKEYIYKKYYENVKVNVNKQNISLHIRRGDYTKVSHKHPILSDNYYSNAIQTIVDLIGEKINLFIFWDVVYEEDNIEVDKTIHYLEIMFQDKISVIKINELDKHMQDWEQLLFMSLCDHNIIANSTFSWWGAYLNTNESKKVCYPDKWFGPKKNHLNTKDLFLSSWCKISY
jgi:hypothetical protein